MSDGEQTFAYEFGDWVVEPHLNRIRRDDEEIQLEPRTLDVLRHLLDHQGEIVSRDELLDTVWAGRVVEPNVIDRNLNRIRQALGDNPREPIYIETISKRGYRTIAPVNRVEFSLATDSNLVAELEAVTPPFPAYEGDEPYVFVCYSHDDREQVYRELNRLRSAGINVWYDEGISIGSEWTDEIATAVANCSHFLYFVSRKSVDSGYCLDEVNLARNDNKQLVPVHLERTDLPRSLQLITGRFQHLLKYSIPEAEYARKLLATLGSYASNQPSRDWKRLLKRGLALGGIVALIVAIGVFLVRGPGVGVVFDEAQKNSLKLAPFKVLTSAHNEEKVGDAIDTQLRIAARASGLQVVGSPSNWDGGEARYLLEGSVNRVPGGIQVTAYLFSTENGYQVWEAIYDKETTADFSEQAEIASLIMAELADEIDVVGAPTLAQKKPEDAQTGALQGALDAAPSFDEFPSFEEGEGNE